METAFEIIVQNRKKLHTFLIETPRAQLLQIPEGYHNNIWWNIAHVVVTQQLLAYNLSGVPMKVDQALVDKFKKGTFPDGTATDAEIEQVESLLLSTATWLKEDYKVGLFKNFQEYTTSADVVLRKVEDAILFNTYHEGIHFGSILALLKATKKA